MRIEAVVLKSFPPFANALVEFPRCGGAMGEVQLITGQNGTGKTRLLCLLAASLGNLASLKARIGENKLESLVLASFNDEWAISYPGKSKTHWSKDPVTAESLANYFSGGAAPKFSKNSGNSEFLQKPNWNEAFAFRGIAHISDAKIASMAPVQIGDRKSLLSFDAASGDDLVICQSMANLKMSAAMDVLRKAPPDKSRAIRLVDRLEKAVTKITGREFAFDVAAHPETRLRVYWGGVTMTLGQLPDGLRSIIGWIVSCVAKLDVLFPDHPDPLSVPLILLLDEPEGHLHPAWQRKVLPAAQTLFPQAQIFAATHSPFVISSVNEGWIHVLRADPTGVVTFDKPRPCSKGDTFLDAVEDVLGVSVNEWYDPETEQMLASFRQTRDKVLQGQGDYEGLVTLAKTIADRSDSLRDTMARELRQVDRVRAQGASHP